MSKPSFVWFEFDNETQILWQSLTDTPKKTFAFQAKLRELVAQNADSWGVGLDSLKVLDVFLSAVKSDLASRNIKEHELVAHPEFIKLIMVLAYHVQKVLHACIGDDMTNVAIETYTAPVFGQVYARAMSGQAGSLNEQDLGVFYQGLAFLVKADNAFGVSISDAFFVLSVIGARLFGSVERAFYALDVKGEPSDLVEYSLYWAVHDFTHKIPTLYDDQAKELFVVPAFVPMTVPTDEPDEINLADDGANPSAELPQNPTPVATQPVATLQTAPTQTQQPAQAQPTQAVQTPQAPISARKQKARASHTPKLFQEVYQDLKQLTTPSDSDERYQKAVMVLDKIDAHIDGEIAKGKTLDDIVFSQKATQARQGALQLLTQAVKAGNPSAMTRLAVYLFEGRGVPTNTTTATNLIKKSADMGDVRACKLLSRLYYQGFDAENGGIAMNVQMGEHWLGKAADAGHPEAKKVRAYMKQVETLKSEHRTELDSDKRYLMWGAVLLVGLVLIVAMLGVFV